MRGQSEGTRGQLVAQCGGHGNIASTVGAIAATGERWSGPWTFATPEETRQRLAAANFTEIETWLTSEPAPLEPGEPLRAYLRTVVVGAHLARMEESERDAFVEAWRTGCRRRRSTTSGSTSSRSGAADEGDVGSPGPAA